jgi:hypothetical protein
MRKLFTTAILIFLIGGVFVGDNHACPQPSTCWVCLHGNISLPAVAISGEAVLVECAVAVAYSTIEIPRSGSPRLTSLRAPPVLS